MTAPMAKDGVSFPHFPLLEERQMPERFELLDIARDISGKRRLIYGSGPADPAPFVLTLTPQYVARALGKTSPVVP